jgi:ubiquinone/menaquinone biosynthesis C-methylase UbiE
MAGMHFSHAKKNWDHHVEQAERIARSEGFLALREEIVSLAAIAPHEVVLDVGSGTGLLSLAIAHNATKVWALDSSSAMGEYLRVKAKSAGDSTIETVHASATSLPLVDRCIDVVVSNYCFHELSESQKRQALAEAYRVLRPHGRLVIGDMMFSLGLTAQRDRRVVRDKVIAIGRRGLPGIWRLAKNALRLLLGRWEHPADADWWRVALSQAGFEQVAVQTLSHEGGIAFAVRPAAARDRGTTSDLPADRGTASDLPGDRGAASDLPADRGAASDLPPGPRRQARLQPQPSPSASQSAASGNG